MLSPFVLLFIQVEIEKMIDKSIVQKVANELYYLNKPEEIKEEVFRKVLQFILLIHVIITLEKQ